MDIKNWLKKTVLEDASDLHLCVGLPPMMRVRDRFKKITGEVLTASNIKAMAYDLIPEGKKDSLLGKREIDMGIEIKGLCRFRVNIYQDRNGLCLAIRVIPRIIKSIDELGLPRDINKIVQLQRGLVLVTGPTGCGKSATLAAIIDAINTNREAHIITLEDPVEYVHSHKKSIVNQREVGVDAESFSQALRAALREDPDVILVGEMRDLDTVANAVSAAETGHLVFATLHTRSAAQSVNRIIDAFPARQQEQIRVQLAESIEMVLSQVLVPSRDGKRRFLACEIMAVNTAIRNLIREKKAYQISSVIERGGRAGMQTLDQSLKFLIDTQRVTKETARKYAFDKSFLTY